MIEENFVPLYSANQQIEMQIDTEQVVEDVVGRKSASYSEQEATTSQ